MQLVMAQTTGLRGRLVAIGVVLAAVAWAAALAGPVGLAHAGTFEAYLCETPAGTPIGIGGLSEEGLMGASRVYHKGSCTKAKEVITMTVGPYGAGYSNGQGGLYTYSTPAGVTISSYVLHMGTIFACGPISVACGGGSGVVFVTHTGQHDPGYDYRDLGAGTQGAGGSIEATELHGVNWLQMGATCDGEGGDCAASAPIASFEIDSGQFTLVDATAPKVEHVVGPAEGAGPLSGDVEWSFGASDTGSGIYGVNEVVDGKATTERGLDANGGLCVNLEPGGVTKTFASPQPCLTEVNGTESLNTNDLSDGEHTVRVYVEDAAGDTANVFDAKLKTANGPIVEAAPSISGVAQVGDKLTATNGVYELRPEQAWAGAVTGHWDRCVSAASCEEIPGATGATYVPTAEDVGYELAYTTTATAEVTDDVARGLKHSTSAESVPTLAVAAAPGTPPSCEGACATGANGGNGGNGGNGAGSNGGGGGSGTITVDLGGLGLTPSGSGPLGSASSWHVTLAVSPRKVHRHTQIRLSGRVSTSPRPSTGKLVYLEARELEVVARRSQGRTRRVSVYGRWITFMALRAKASGTFATTYRFRLGGTHTYEFRAVAPAEGGYRNPTGTSSAVVVHES